MEKTENTQEQVNKVLGSKSNINVMTKVYIKSVAVRPEHLEYIDSKRGEKSKARFLDEMIEFYKLNN